MQPGGRRLQQRVVRKDEIGRKLASRCVRGRLHCSRKLSRSEFRAATSQREGCESVRGCEKGAQARCRRRREYIHSAVSPKRARRRLGDDASQGVSSNGHSPAKQMSQRASFTLRVQAHPHGHAHGHAHADARRLPASSARSGRLGEMHPWLTAICGATP